MDRKEFLKFVGLSLTSYIIVQNFAGCGDSNPTAPTNVDFTIDLNQTQFANLKNSNGWVVYNNILIFRNSNGILKAVSSKCTHEGVTLEYSPENLNIICPKHGSEFSIDGKVTKGPAKKNLVVYKVEENGNVVRIFS